MKRIVIAGGTGFLGKALSSYFVKEGYEVITLSRKRIYQQRPDTGTIAVNRHKTIYWDGETEGEWSDFLEGAHALINLSGKSVDCRYTPRNKQLIMDSRVVSTRVLNDAVKLCIKPPKYFLNSSTATIYEHSEVTPNTEANGKIGDDFSMNVARAWEEEFFTEKSNHVKRIALRTSIVLGNTGGAFPVLKRLAKFGLGGKAGSGNQKFSWIHIQDFCRAVEFLIQSDLEGPVNVTSPNPIDNAHFMKTLRQSLNQAIGIPQSKWMLELGAFFLQTETELVLKSRYVIPERLIQAGFEFQYPTIKTCLKNLLT